VICDFTDEVMNTLTESQLHDDAVSVVSNRSVHLCARRLLSSAIMCLGDPPQGKKKTEKMYL
jgi:hypothetical protein